MQNYIPLKDFISQLVQKSFFIIYSGEREYLISSSIINGEKDKFYRLSDVSEALGKSIIHQKDENGTTEYVDMSNLKAMLLNKELNLDQLLADLESSLVGLLFKNLVDTAIALSGNMVDNNKEKNNVEQLREKITEKEIEKALEKDTNTKPQTNKKPYYYNKRYNKDYKRQHKSDKT